MEKFITTRCEVCKGTGKLKRANPAYLRKRREDSGTSLRQFAKRVGVSPTHISDVELGRRFPIAEIIHAYEKLTKESHKD